MLHDNTIKSVEYEGWENLCYLSTEKNKVEEGPVFTSQGDVLGLILHVDCIWKLWNVQSEFFLMHQSNQRCLENIYVYSWAFYSMTFVQNISWSKLGGTMKRYEI